MKIKQLLSLLLAVTFSLSLWAEQISPEAAAEIAASFVNERPALRKAHKAPQSAATMRLAHTRKKAASSDNAFYVFNRADNAGFIIVSADDRTAEDILGYSDGGRDFDIETINPNLRWWLNRYAEEISAIEDNDEAAAQPRKAVQATAIAPLLKNQDGKEITWYQEAPYYNYCPIDQRDNTRSLTGCVATATSQIMYKWQYPAKGTGSHSYTWKDCKNDKCTSYTNITVSSNFDTVYFDWDNMLPAYVGVSATAAQKKAVASLMYNVGVAADMQYGGDANGGSGAWTDDMAYGLQNYFGYTFDKFITMYSQSDYGTAAVTPAEYSVTSAQFTSYFNADLEAGRPILMGGEDTDNGGHEFVCDGRDANNKFHINWGWEGDGNGYFALTSLKPTGSSYNFSTNLDALIGLRPAKTYADVNVTWMANGEEFAQTVASHGVLTLPTATPQDCANGKVFVGWTAEADYEGDAAPSFVKGGTLIEEDAIYYAVYARAEEVEGAGETTVTFTPGTDTGEATVTKDGVTCLMTTMNNSSYYQIYANQSGTFECESGNITKIEFECTASGTAKYGPGNASANVGEYSYSGKVGTWTGSASSVTISTTAQIRMSSLKITHEGGSGIYYSDFSTSCGSTESCEMNSIGLNTDKVQKTFVTGEAFNYDGLVVTAYYNNCNSRVVTPNSVSTPDMSTAGEKGVTVQYIENGAYYYAAYTINVVDPETFTVRFFSNGVQVGEAQQVVEGQQATVPAVEAPCEGYAFYGWFTEAFAETENAPAMVEDFKATKDQDYYAVFSRTETTEGQGGGQGGSKTFKFAEIASANNWENGTAYTPVIDAPVTITAEGGGNNAKWYNSNSSWRMYSGGTVRISVEGSEVTSVTSSPSCDWTISNGEATFSASARTDFTEIVVNYGAGGSSTSVTYYTTAPDCEPIVPPVCALASITLDTANVKTAFKVGDAFNYDGLKVTAHYEGCASEEVFSYTVSTPNMDLAGAQQVTVTYSYEGITKTAQYKITISEDQPQPVEGDGYVLTDLADIAAEDVVIITMTNSAGTYALFSGNGTGSAPTAVAVTVEDDAIETSEENIYWNISQDGDNLTIYPEGTTDSWLYSTATNNGVRVGTNTNSTWSINSNYLYHNGTSRFMGVYNSQDWRAYTSINANIKDQTLAFYVKKSGDTPSLDPSIAGANVDFGSIELNADGIATASLSMKVTAKNLTENITVAISGNDKDKFSAANTLDKEGGELAITFLANVAGEYEAVISLSANNIVKEYTLSAKVTEPAVVKDWYTVAEVEAMFVGTLPTDSITVRGYVTKIQTAYDERYNNITFWMDDAADGSQSRFEAYRIVPVSESDQAVVEGDYVEATGILTLFNNKTKEFAAGGQYRILSAHETIAVTGVTLNVQDTVLELGSSMSLVATVLPADADNQNVTWATDNEQVATVEDGYVKAVGEGETTITVTTEDGEFTAQCIVTVKAPVDPTFYTIRFFSNGAQIGEEQSILEGLQATVPADPQAECEAYSFVGWWTDTLVETNTEKKDWVTDFTATKDQDYYAIFSKTEASEGGESATITFTPGTDTGETSVTKEGVTCTLTTMSNSSYYQIYANQSGTFECESGNITKIEFVCTASGTTKYGPGNASANVGEYTYEDKVGTWTGEASSITISTTAQIRMSSLEITIGGGSTTYYSSLVYCGESAIDNAQAVETVARKVLMNGQIMILRGEAVYSITGARVK